MSAASLDVSDVSGTDRARGPAAYRDEDFPGCESFPLPASEIDHYENRLEFWDGVTETAWKVREPTSIQHEQPSRRLVRMAERVASLRGTAIECFGSGDLVRVDASGRKRWLMQADEVLYLHPDRVRLRGPAIDVDADPLPDVVLEVDHTTDVRRRKLGIYKESGFPEIWVLVPWDSSRRAPGLAIHVRRGDGYREEPSSRAFPEWRAEEIHRALTRGTDVGGGVARAGASGAGDGSARGHGAGGRSAHALAECEGTDEGSPGGPRKGPDRDARGERAHGAEGPGNCGGSEPDGASRAPRRAVRRRGACGGAGVHGRGRLPAAGPRAARAVPSGCGAWRGRSVTRPFAAGTLKGEPVPGGVEQPVLRDAQRGVHLALSPLILRPGAA